MWRFSVMRPPHLPFLEVVRLLLWEFLLQFAAVLLQLGLLTHPSKPLLCFAYLANNDRKYPKLHLALNAPTYEILPVKEYHSSISRSLLYASNHGSGYLAIRLISKPSWSHNVVYVGPRGFQRLKERPNHGLPIPVKLFQSQAVFDAQINAARPLDQVIWPPKTDPGTVLVSGQIGG